MKRSWRRRNRNTVKEDKESYRKRLLPQHGLITFNLCFKNVFRITEAANTSFFEGQWKAKFSSGRKCCLN